jgi:hypothetical protein
MKFIKLSRNRVKAGVLAAAALLIGGVMMFSTDHSVGASASFPAPSHTGGPDENSCTTCHVTHPVNSGPGSVKIFGIPRNYIPGRTYPISVRVAQETATVFGFQMVPIDKDGRKAGQMSIPPGVPAKMQLMDGFVNVFTRQYIAHTIDGLFTQGVFGSNTWEFTWTAPSLSMGKIGFYASGNAADGDGRASGDHIYTTAEASLSGTATSNFSGGLASDVAVFRPSSGQWFSNSILDGTIQVFSWGSPGDIPVPGDYDGDGTTDLAVYRPSTGQWFLNMTTEGISVVSFGVSQDKPAQADYDGDGRTDIALYRPLEGRFFIMGSTAGTTVVSWGIAEDKPVVADYDGDGKADVAVYRPSNGNGYIARSTGGVNVVSWGLASDKPVPADYDGDGKADIAVYRPSEGRWFTLNTTAGIVVTSWGLNSDIAAPADYDGDGKTDIAVYRPSDGRWYLNNTQSGITVVSWGIAEDLPVAAYYFPQQ